MYTFNTTDVFLANYQATEGIVINQGGTDSGKTYALIQVLFTFATTTTPPKEDPIITVIGESVPNLKKGAYRVAKSIIGSTENFKEYIKSVNETDRTITFKSGWIMEFISCETEQSAKQGKRQYAFFNEANGVTWQIFWQIAKRTRIRTFIDYNPSAPFWAHENLIGTNKDTNDLGMDVKLIISDHRHNTFLSEEEHRRTESIKDAELWRVYARGLTGNLSGLIFPNWKVIPDDKYPWQNDKFFGGLDFGYTNDPTAGVKIVKVGDSLFVHELCYMPGISPVEIKQIFEANGFGRDHLIYCDHDPDMISQLRRLGVMAFAARKGAGSINAGILKLKEYDVFYTQSSVNLAMERAKYMWIKDQKTGKAINTPIDIFNHLMDATRIAVYTHLFRTA